MATNSYLGNIVFNAAESATSSFLRESNDTKKFTNDEHVLSAIRRLPVNTPADLSQKKEYNEKGERKASAFIDGEGGIVKAKIEVSVVDHCDNTCGGFSLGISRSGSHLGCRNYKLEGKGEVVKAGKSVKSHDTTLWAREITAC